MKIFKSLLLTATAILLGGCSLPGVVQQKNDARFEIGVSILPYQDIVERIVGDDVTVFSIVPEGYNPETYEPSPQEMKRLSSAKLVVLNGNLPYEQNIETVLSESGQDTVVIKLNEALQETDFLPLGEHHHDEEDEHDATDDHDEEQPDPHTWLSPRLMIQQLPSIVMALQKIDPDYTDRYVQNAVTVVAELEKVSADLHEMLDKHWGRSFLVYHPAFGYFAQEFNLTQRFIEIEGKEPSATQIKDSLQLVASEQISAIYLEKQFSTRTAESLAQELQVPIEYVNPLSSDYFGTLQEFAMHLAEGFSNSEK
ncbi:MAG: hypothetical protein CO156_02440 [Candidatus Pacebacteria bacterium CG_4_9_14_3_um_filter_40_12]|nr:zinc ABC transporter solute-binding protein [Candidatus Paceibacterota bacterium]PIR63266.1 MAG: hypothetical protein COU64_05245 [Candidatus Pacebacteria bacterium CG10_big_fil_rev_8_21_14_0_10_40_26]PIZ79147.1 MAG: hypothetical protein COY01_01835 [Candidatus Pacebacteria bacterium CG_4_10_14_0_2_um_filter_40_20]PJA68802.1 MAG: hypothetical protein CO156_02440 [Candidatus Pacebacteria bacterium CG_4_9_14_3_um_filter_40_12]PJC42113.1 MAG: hypothetical protein CO041_00545 [Candidatus Pacebac